MKLAQRYKSFIYHLKDKKKTNNKIENVFKKQCQKYMKQTFKTNQGVLK